MDAKHILAPRDLEFNSNPGGQVLKTYAPAPDGAPTAKEDDWPMFRGNPVRGNAAAGTFGRTLTLKWEAAVGLGKQTYGAMDSERTGLTQAVSAWGMVVVADIEGQRVVALDPETGKTKWVFHVGSRVDFSPALHEGLCLFSAKDGWAYCLDAKNGDLIYKLLIAPQERYIGGQERIESMWPGCGDVLVVNGVAYSSAGQAASIHGGIRVVAFKPRTGEVVWRQCLQGKPAVNDGETQPGILVWNQARNLIHIDGVAFETANGKTQTAPRDAPILHVGCFEDWLATNNRHRLSEDMGGAAIDNGKGGVAGRLIAFSDSFGVGFTVPRKDKSVFHVGPLNIAGKSRDGKTTWSLPPTELNVDDFVLTPDSVYVVGHYENGEGPSELWVVSREDGKILATHKLSAFPAYNGMSAAGNRLFVATREGKLICYKAE